MRHPLGRLAAILAAVVTATAVSVVLPPTVRPALAAQTVCPAAVVLTNGDFEQPVISSGSVSIMSQSLIPGWLTTASDRQIELWRGYGGVVSASGSQHAELNANMVSTLYQDLPTTPGQTLRWQLSHRGRTGTDTMAVVIGAPSGTLVQQGSNISDPNTAWGTYSGVYTVPAGQTSTRFAFRSVSSASTSPSVGNFLDAISFGSAACLGTTTTVANANGSTSANVGDTLTYTVTTRNNGGNPARLASVSDVLPVGTTYVPGSLRSISGSTTVKPTDASGDDVGEYNAGSRTVNVRVGSGANSSTGGTLAPGDSQTVSYQVLVTSALAGTTLDNDTTAAYTETLSGSATTSTSDTASIAVNPAADLSVTAALASAAVVAGQAVAYTVTASNAGPSAATSVQLIGTVPAGLTGVTAASPGGTCTVSGTRAECDYVSVASGATRTMTITGNVPPGETPATTYTLAAAVTSATYETNQADNSASVSKLSTASANLGVTLTYAPAVPIAGSTITYSAVITNQGPSTARSIVLSDPIPSGSTNASAVVPGGSCASTSTGTIECTLASLASGASVTVTITMTLSGTTVNNAVSLNSSTPDPDISNNIVTVTGAGAQQADIGITLSLGATTAYAGDTTTYTLMVHNYGPSMADNVTFVPVLPPGVSIIRPTTGPFAAYCTPNACTIPHLPNGATIPLSGTVVLAPDAQAGPGTATVTVISTTTDNNPANDKLTTNFTVLLRSDLSVAQTITDPDRSGSNAVAGEHVRNVVTVTNQGQTRAEGVLVQQPIPAGQPVPAASTAAGACTFQGTTDLNGITPDGGLFVCSQPQMATGATWTITFDSLLPAGFSGANFARTATVSATSPDPDSSNDSVTTTIPVARIADLGMSETTGTPHVTASDPVQFTVTARNTGPSDATTVVIQVQPQTGLLISAGSAAAGTYDPGTGRWSVPVVAAGATLTLTLTGTALVAGSPANTVRLLSADSTDPAAGNNTAQATVVIDPANSSLRITAAATVAPAGRQNAALAGDTVTYRFTVVNDGNVTMSQISAADALTGTATCPGTSLAAGASMVCTSTTPYVITQADFDAQQPVYNNATVTATPPGGAAAATFGPAAATVTLATGTASMRATVTAAVSPSGHTGAARVGDTVTYTYLLTNDGNAALTRVAATDTLGGAVTCPSATLAVNASMTCTGGTPYTVTQADIDAGGPVADAATLTGRLANAASDRTFGPFSTSVAVVPAAPALSAVVTAAVTPPARQSAAAKNDTISYSYAVTNTGNVTMTGIGVTDTRTGIGTCPGGPLAVNATVTCTSTGSYAVTQADVDAGAPISDSATVSGRAPGAAASAYGPFSTAVPVAVAAPMLAVAVNATVSPLARQNAARAGDTIGYSYTVSNNGNVTMSAIAVTDTRLGAATCPATPLTAGASVTCTIGGTYTVTQADVDAGNPIVATASVTGRAPGAVSGTTFGPASTSVTVAAAAPSLAVTVATAVNPAAHQSAVRVGDTIAFTYTVVNDGNVTMTGIALTDPLAGTVTCPGSTLLVGASMTCTGAAPYTVTQARIDAGLPITVSTTVAAGAPGGGTPAFGPFTATINVAPSVPSLSMAVTALVTPPSRQNQAQVNDTIAYRYDLSNTGNVTMDTIAIADTRGGAGSCPATTLAVGASMTCTSTGSYTVDQNDINTGTPIADSATLTARAPTAAGAGTYATGSDTVALAQAAASLTVTTTPAVTPPANRFAAATGNTIDYSYLVTNNGNVPMTAVGVTDSLIGAVTCPGTTLAVAASMTCTSVTPYTVTQTDVDTGGSVASTATVQGQGPSDLAPQPYGPFPASVPIAPANPLLQITTTGNAGGVNAGSTVTFSYAVRNIGNVTMDTLRVSGSTGGAASCLVTTLSVGAGTTCTGGTYTITQTDVDTGAPISDTGGAIARRGGTPTDLTFAAPAVTAPVAAAAPTLTIASTATVSNAAHQSAAAAGDSITYAYTVTNTGNVTMDTLAVTDTLFGTVTCPGAPLAVTATVVCSTATRPVTQSDLDAGLPIVSDAHIHGRQVGFPAPYSFGPAIATINVAPATTALTAAVTAVISPAGHVTAADTGDTVTFRTVLTNSGNQTISDLSVTDPRSGAATCPATSLAPNASMTCLSTTPYTVTTADVDTNAPVATTVTVAGRSPGAASATTLTSPSASFPVVASGPALGITASTAVTPAGHHDQLMLGDTIAYRYTVRNIGNVTMTGIAVTDTRSGSAACAATTLAPGATTNCTGGATYPVTQPDVEAGTPITSSVTATGRATGTVPVLSFGPVTTTELMAAAADSLALAVSATVAPAAHQLGAVAGDTVTYRYTVTNDGDVAVTGISLTDSRAGRITCPTGPLAVGAVRTCAALAPYQVTQADVDAGVALADQAEVRGRRPGAPSDTVYDQQSGSVPVAPAQGQLLVGVSAVIEPKTRAGEISAADVVLSAAPAAGDNIRYHYKVFNTGNVTMTHVSVHDGLVGKATCPSTTLAVGQSMSCVADAVYQVTQQDIDTGRIITNTAVASGADPATTTVQSPPGAANTPVEPAAPSVTASQQLHWNDADGDGKPRTTDDITSTVEVANNGNVTLTGVVLTGLPVTVTCPSTTLAPGEKMTCTSAPYHLSEQDIAGGTSFLVRADASTPTKPSGVQAEAPGSITPAAPSASPSPSISPSNSPSGHASPSHSPTPTATPTHPATPTHTAAPTRSPGEPGTPAAPSPLPRPHSPVTGGDYMPLLIGGWILVAGGVALILLSRRRLRRR
ncbi:MULTISPECIES: DUF11 domain-containing protein [unclassified Actinoplanes]|uniref:DUF7507 domain-containing protein n=1 Tax=unclassified Actinoplanes TaxID=2626549 RepID=UPI0003097072|nr:MULTISPECIES: DUF11 domain-containing protein [unclassified Actinoplanes]